MEDQYRACDAWCAREGATVVGRFEDQEISGGAMGNRPGLRALLSMQVDLVVAYYLYYLD